MSEADTVLGFIVPQVMQNAESHHNIRISKTRVIPKALGVANYERSLASVSPFGGSDTGRIDVEPKVIDVWKPP